MTHEPKAIESKSDMRTVARLLADHGIMSRIEGDRMFAAKAELWIDVTDYTMMQLFSLIGLLTS